MDLTKQDHAIGDVADVISGAVKIFKSAKDKKKAKEAQVLSDQGHYWFLSPEAKAMIEIPFYVYQQVQGKGITREAILSMPKKPKGTPFEEILPELQARSGGFVGGGVNLGAGNTAESVAAGQKTTVAKAIPYIAGVVVIGLIIYLISKR